MVLTALNIDSVSKGVNDIVHTKNVYHPITDETPVINLADRFRNGSTGNARKAA